MQYFEEQDLGGLTDGVETDPLLLPNQAYTTKSQSEIAFTADDEGIPAVDLAPSGTGEEDEAITVVDPAVSSNLSENLGGLPQQHQAPKETFLDQCRFAFLETFLFDGFDIRKKKVATSQGVQAFCHAEESTRYSLSWSLIITSLLGLPNRLEKIEKTVNGRVRFRLELSFLQFLRALFGGWDPLHEDGKLVWTPKKILQIFAIPFKGLIIFPLKLFVVFPFKVLVNIAKLFTEFLPAIGIFIFAPLLSSAFQGLRNSFKDEKLGFGKQLLFFTGYLIYTLVVLVPFLLSRALKFFGMTITSPDKSARISYTSVKKSVKNNLMHLDMVKKRPWLRSIISASSYFLGVLSAMLSILTTAGLWAVTFPLIFGAIVTYIPILQQAILSISQLPIIATYLASLESSLAVVGIGTAHAYGAFIKALSGIFSIEVSTFVLLVGTAFGALAAPVCSGLSRIADALSDWWATWNKQPFFEHLKTLFMNTDVKKKSTRGSSGTEIELQTLPQRPGVDAIGFTQNNDHAASDSLIAVQQADDHLARVTTEDSKNTTTKPKNPRITSHTQMQQKLTSNL